MEDTGTPGVRPRSPTRSGRKRPLSPDRERTTSREAEPPTYMHGDPRVEGLSQLSDIIGLGPAGGQGSPKDRCCCSPLPCKLTSIQTRPSSPSCPTS